MQLVTYRARQIAAFAIASVAVGLLVAGCSSTDADSTATASPSVFATPSDGATIMAGAALNPTTMPPDLSIDGHAVKAVYVDWSAVSGEPPADVSSIASPTWLDVPLSATGDPAAITFSDGPPPIAVSVVGYDAIGPDGLPVGEGAADHGTLPAAGVATADSGLTFETQERPEYLAVQFRWSVPSDQRAAGQEGNASVTAAYLVHLTHAS